MSTHVLVFLLFSTGIKNQISDSERTGPLDLTIKKFLLGAPSSEKGETRLSVPIVAAYQPVSKLTNALRRSRYPRRVSMKQDNTVIDL